MYPGFAAAPVTATSFSPCAGTQTLQTQVMLWLILFWEFAASMETLHTDQTKSFLNILYRLSSFTCSSKHAVRSLEATVATWWQRCTSSLYPGSTNTHFETHTDQEQVNPELCAFM